MAGIEAMWNAGAVLAVGGVVLEETLLIGGKQVVIKTLSKKEYKKILDQALKEKVNGYKVLTSEGGSSSRLAQYGDEFGKMGTYVENPNIKVDWSQYASHGAERMQQRGMTQEMIENIIENGKVLSQSGGNKFAYITKEGVAVVSKEGKLITGWTNANFDESMIGILSKLYGE